MKSYHVEGSSGNLFLFVDDTTSLVEALVDTTHGVDGGCDLSEEDGLLESGLSSELAGVVKTSSGRHDLSGTSVDGISMQHAIEDVHSNTSHVLLTEGTFLGGPLPGTIHGVTKLVHVLHS
jgi:hypothetical protein